MSRDQAEQLGAMALFGEKYGKQVRVVAIGADEDISSAFSKEFCGGTHVNRLGEIGDFKILKEESVSAGVRRITAITGQSLKKYRDERDEILRQVCEVLKVPAEQAVDKAKKIVKENKKLNKELKNASKSSGTDVMAEARGLLEKSEKVNGSSIITGALSNGTAKDGRAAVDMLKKKAGSAGVLLGFADDGKVMLVCGVTDDLIEKGLKAGDIVKEIAPIVGGGGGGRPQMAQAGGKNPDKLNEAVTKAAELMKQKLNG
jgi:alanyl-tRNA synthetase